MRSGLKLGGRTLFYYAVLILLCFLFVSISGNIFWLQLVLNLAILAGFGMLLLNDAGYRGERACTLGATLDKQREEGRRVDPAQEKERWSVKTGVIGYFAAVLPLLMIALVNLAVLPLYPQTLEPVADVEMTDDQLFSAAYQKMMGEEGLSEQTALPEDPQATARPDATATPAPDGAIGGGSEDVYVFNPFNLVARIAFMPFVSLYTLLRDNVLLLFILFVPLSFVMPAFSLVGYLSGPRLRQKKLEAIKKGKRRKMKNLKVNKKPKEPRQPKPEV